MADTKFVASALLALQLATGGQGAQAQQAPAPVPQTQEQTGVAEGPDLETLLAEARVRATAAKPAAPEPTPEEVRRDKINTFLLEAARDNFLKVAQGAEDRYSRELARSGRQFTRYMRRAEGDRALDIAFIDPAKFDAGMALGMDADAVTRMLVGRTNVSDKVIDDASRQMQTEWKTPLGIKVNTQNPSAHHDFFAAEAQSCVIVPPSAYHPDAFNIPGLSPQQNRELINKHEGWHCLDHRSNFAGMTEEQVNKEGTPENAKAISILNRAESLADVGATGDMIRNGMGTDIIDKMIVWRQDTSDLEHMSIASLTALKAKINDMGIDRFRRLNDKDARALYENITDNNTLTPGMADIAGAYQRASRAEQAEFRAELRDNREEVLKEAPEAEKALAYVRAYPSYTVPGFTYAQNADFSRLREDRADAPSKYNIDDIDPEKMKGFDIDDFAAIRGDPDLQKAVALLNGKQAYADVGAAGDLIRKGHDPARIIHGVLSHNIANMSHLDEATAPALLALHARIGVLGLDNFRRLSPAEAEKFYEQTVDANTMTPAMVKSILEYAELPAADQRKAERELTKPDAPAEFADLKVSLDFIKAYPDVRVPAYSYQENIDFNRLREARLAAPGKFTQLPEEVLKTLAEAKEEGAEKNLDKPERLAALVTEHRMETYADVAAAGDMIRKGGNPTAVIDRLVEHRSADGDNISTMSVAALKDFKRQVQEMGIAKFNKLSDTQLQAMYENTTQRKTLSVGMAEMVIAYGAADADNRAEARRDAGTAEARKQYPEFEPALAFMRDYAEPSLKDELGRKQAPDLTMVQARMAEQVEQWDALGALVDRAFKKDGKITPATLVEAYGDIQDSLRRQMEKDPSNALYKEQMGKLQTAFVDNVQEIDYVEANRSRGVDIVQKERGLAEALGEKPAPRPFFRNPFGSGA